MSGIRAVVFDIGNVLLEWRPERFYDAQIGGDRRAALFASVDLDGMNERIDAGAPWEQSVAACAAAHPAWAAEIALWHHRWPDMLGPVIAPNLALLRRLRSGGIPVFALSNFGTETFALARREYPFLTEFDQSFISGHLGVIKPDPAIYSVLETETAMAPDHLFFIDDRPENIAAAQDRGWHGHVFRDSDALEQEIAALRLV